VSHTRPAGTGWVTGQHGEPVEVQGDPPGDGIGPDLTPPDQIEGQDAKEFRRLQREHEKAMKTIGTNVLSENAPELHETAEVEPTPHPFPDARATGPQDPATEVEDPREQTAPASDPARASRDRGLGDVQAGHRRPVQRGS